MCVSEFAERLVAVTRRPHRANSFCLTTDINVLAWNDLIRNRTRSVLRSGGTEAPAAVFSVPATWSDAIEVTHLKISYSPSSSTAAAACCIQATAAQSICGVTSVWFTESKTEVESGPWGQFVASDFSNSFVVSIEHRRWNERGM